jgi:hypothetical protein
MKKTFNLKKKNEILNHFKILLILIIAAAAG